MTRDFCRTKASTMASPIPLAPPVTTTFFFWRLRYTAEGVPGSMCGYRTTPSSGELAVA